ncbi:MAG: serine/threonine protein kinase [Acidobacteria bacterium]|nr:serine/threonine protein kinase [Acidobacteriota bacterium]
MEDERRCPRCGATLLGASDACVRCLLALGLEAGGPSPEAGPAPASSAGPPAMPERIGRFRLLDVLSAGDTSTVSLAEEEPGGRRVVLRVLSPREDAHEILSRFEAERDALLSARHPGLASVVDGGVSEEGCPWFATEWVPGVPLTELCDRKRLTVRQRLGLFVEVCEAIEHGNARGLAHLNLQPGKVLATEEADGIRVRVIDLGLARVLDRRPTEQVLYSGRGLLEGTLGYLSPEQLDPADLAPDARTDVYALGALLYELLVGVTPFDSRRLLRKGWAGMSRIIQQESPEPPSRRVAGLGNIRLSEVSAQRRTEARRLVRELRGDLDWITLKALEKEPSRRHASAGGLGFDVRQVLDGEPVEPGLRALGRRLLRAVRR